MCRAGGRRCPSAGGRSTQNTRQAVSRARRALREARHSGDPTAVDTARQRLADARAAHREAKDAADRHDHATAGHDRDVTAARVLRPPIDRPSSARPLGEGSMADTELLTYPDGTRLVRKRNGSKAEDCGADPVELTDAEELAPHVLAAVGLPYAAVHRTAPDEVLMEYVDGRSGTELTGGRRVPDTYSDSPDGRLLGLVDHVIGNRDRNADNWIQTDDGRLVGIDHGVAFDAGLFSTSPFARSLYDRNERTTLRPNEFTPADMDHLGQRLAALRPEFDKHGRADWHDSMMRRHHDLAQYATGTTDLITGHRQTKDTAVNQHHHEGQDHAADHDNTPRHSGDVTPRTTQDDDTASSSTQHTRHTWTNDRGERVTVHNTVNGHADNLIQTAVVYGDVHFTAAQGGGVTDTAGRATGQGRPAGDGRHDTRTAGFTLHNTNIVHPGAHVGSQHDVHHGTRSTVHNTGGHHDSAADDGGDGTGDHFRETLHVAEETLRHVTRHTTRNVASGNDHVTQQVGFTPADPRRLRRR